MDIKFLYFEGCPHQKEAYRVLKEVCFEKEISESIINLIEIKSGDDAEKYNFLGSPSIQFNNKDIEDSRKNDKPLFGCRIYKDNHNAGVPSREMIQNALEKALNTSFSEDRKGSSKK